MSASSYVHVDFQKVSGSTAKAIQIVRTDGTALWLPRSVVSDGDSYDVGDEDGTVSIQSWFAEKEGIEGD